jgi:hypothetical protein
VTTTTTEHDQALREWARGLLPLEAATELLIRAGFAGEERPWVRHDSEADRPWIDFASIPEHIGGMSGGEQRFLRIAASLGADSPIILADELAGLDREWLSLVLAAIAHTGDAHEPGRTIELVDGSPRFVDVPALYAWPAA